jgi:hypothetical protein
MSITTTVSYRLVATFPLSGEGTGYSILRTEDERGEHVHGLPHYSIMFEGRVIRGEDTFEDAIATCLRNAGWGHHVVRTDDDNTVALRRTMAYYYACAREDTGTDVDCLAFAADYERQTRAHVSGETSYLASVQSAFDTWMAAQR